MRNRIVLLGSAVVSLMGHVLTAPTTTSTSSADRLDLSVANVTGPLIDGERFPDPSVIKVDGMYYAFSANDYKGHATLNIPIARSAHLRSGWEVLPIDAMPTLGAWTEHPDGNSHVWDPDVSQLPDGTFIMYYAAIPKNHTHHEHCIGWATASNITGPYQPHDEHWFCPRHHGAIGTDTILDGAERYVLFRNDSVDDEIHKAKTLPRIDLQQVDASDGYTRILGRRFELYTSTRVEHDAEGPALVKNPFGGWVLLYVTGFRRHENRQIRYATAETITGNYTYQGVLMNSGDKFGDEVLKALGGLDFVGNGTEFVFMADSKNGTKHWRRQMHAATLVFHDKETVSAKPAV